MKTQTKNILVLTANGHYIAELLGGGMRAGVLNGAFADFAEGSPEAHSLKALAPCPFESIDKFCAQMIAARRHRAAPTPRLKDGSADWESTCDVCGQKPTVTPTGLCGPCCFGEAATAGGNW